MLRDLATWIFTDPINGQVASYRIAVLVVLCATLILLYSLKRDFSFLRKKVDKIDTQTNGKPPA